MDPLVLFRNDIIICTKQPDQGPDFRTAIEKAYHREIVKVDQTDPEMFTELANLSADNEFKVYLILP